MIPLDAGVGLVLVLTVVSANLVQAKCGDGVTTVGEACDNGTPTCAAGATNVGSECNKSGDCQGLSVAPHTGSAGDLCRCTLGSCRAGTVGDRDDVPNACRSACMPPLCGDGVSDAAEQCDPGSSTSTSGPCLGNVPKSVCKNSVGLCHGGGGNAAALIRCSNDGQCAICGGTCTGNPACNLAQCGDKFVCSDAACLTGSSPFNYPPGGPGPEVCDDGNASNMDACTPFGFLFSVAGTPAIPDQCQANICGDGATNMAVEQCDSGTALCVGGPKATVPPSKPCCSNDDCNLGSITTGVCSAGLGLGNGNVPDQACTLGHQTCRCNCNFPSCGDGISDSCDGEQCDDGTTVNGPGHFCNKVRRCVGGENPGALCMDNSTCTKGTCGQIMCEENICGDDTVAGNEMCDDSNIVAGASTDNCGVNATVAAGVNAVLHPGCNTALTGALANQPTACIQPNCVLGLCGDGVTEPGEMCDAGFSVCSAASATAQGVTLLNPNAPCCQASDCKTTKTAAGTSPDVCVSPTLGSNTGGNRDDLANHCRCTCMPPSCGNGVLDSGEQCDNGAENGPTKPCTSVCTIATCGDGQVCSDPACTSGPNGGPEQCDDGNATDPSSTNTDTCWFSKHCLGAFCGDGVTSPGEQCDSVSMGCSNMNEARDAAQEQVAAHLECCYDGEVVEASKQTSAGLIDAEHALVALDKCKIPKAVGNLACDKWLQKKMVRIQNNVLAAETYTEQNDQSRATRIMHRALAQIDRILSSRRWAKQTSSGGACAGVRMVVANELSDIREMAQGISGP